MSRLSYILCVMTIATARLSLHFLESHNINKYAYFLGIRWHHLYTGAVLTGIGFLLPKNNRLRPILFGIGAGLMIDESFLPMNFYGFYNFTYWYFGSWLIMLAFLTAYLLTAKKYFKKHST